MNKNSLKVVKADNKKEQEIKEKKKQNYIVFHPLNLGRTSLMSKSCPNII